MELNLQKIFKKLDIIDIILIIVIIILLYIAISDNFEYYSTPEIDSEQLIKYNEDYKQLDNDNNENQDIQNLSMQKSSSQAVQSIGSPIADKNVVNNANQLLSQNNNMQQNIINSELIQQLCFMQKDILNLSQDHNNTENNYYDLETSPEQNGIFNKIENLFNSKNVEGLESQNNKDNYCNIDLIHAEWCGFCKKAKPHWDKLKDEYHEKNINSKKVLFNEYEEKQHEHLIGQGKKYEVDGFPTIFLTMVENGIEQSPIKFNAITYDTILENIKKYI